MHLHTRNCNTAFVKLVQYFNGQRDVLRDPPVVRRSSRNGDVLMIDEPVTITYTHPRERVLFNPARDANPFFHVYEALWMLAGRNDVTSVAYYAKQMKEYSDDGGTLNGAYGYRWRQAYQRPQGTVSSFSNDEQRQVHWHHQDASTVDQLDILVNHLKADPTSRRAVLQMWNVEDDLLKIGMPCVNCQGTGIYKGRYTPDDPTSEYVEEPCEDCDGKGKTGQSLDTCCNLSVMFSIRVDRVIIPTYPDEIPSRWTDGKKFLDMTVTNRSNDLIWGMLGANVVHFSFLQEYMAARLGVEVGRYHHFSNNLHIYEKIAKMDLWLASEEPTLYEVSNESMSSVSTIPLVKDPVRFESELPIFVEHFNGNSVVQPKTWMEPFLEDVAQPMLMAFQGHKLKSATKTSWVQKIKAEDWRVACDNWIIRRAR